MQKTNQKEFRVEKVTKRKKDKLYAKWKECNNLFSSWIDKKNTQYKWVNLFQNQKTSAGRAKFQLDLSNYATKVNLKKATGADTSKFG